MDIFKYKIDWRIFVVICILFHQFSWLLSYVVWGTLPLLHYLLFNSSMIKNSIQTFSVNTIKIKRMQWKKCIHYFNVIRILKFIFNFKMMETELFLLYYIIKIWKWWFILFSDMLFFLQQITSYEIIILKHIWFVYFCNFNGIQVLFFLMDFTLYFVL